MKPEQFINPEDTEFLKYQNILGEYGSAVEKFFGKEIMSLTDEDIKKALSEKVKDLNDKNTIRINFFRYFQTLEPIRKDLSKEIQSDPENLGIKKHLKEITELEEKCRIIQEIITNYNVETTNLA